MIRHQRLDEPRRQKALGSVLLAALLILQQGLSFLAVAGDVVETPKISMPLNIGGAAGMKTAPALTNLPVNGAANLGVNVEVPVVGEIGGNLQTVKAQAQIPTAQIGVNGALVETPKAEGLVTTPEAVSPAATAPEAQAPKAEQKFETQTGVLKSELGKPEANSGSRFSLFTRFFDRRAKSQGADLSPVSVVDNSGMKAEPALARSEPKQTARRKFVEFNVQYLKDIKSIFNESKTKPNKQDFVYLVTKTWGLNLIVRAAFALKGVHAGQLGVARAILSTGWYQIQDSVFTVFGQTYMKFLGRMTPMLRVGNAKLGDLLFVYVQLVASEFMNRLVLGPLGENPLVYSWHGIGLLLLNNLQGMISGGLIVPVINKLKAAGVISEKASSNLYQLASLTMHLGLLATFGYQHLFTVLTTIIMFLSWAAYIGASFFLKDKSADMGGGKL